MHSTAVAQGQAEIETVIYGYLAKRFPKVATWNSETSLLESGIIDSLGVLELMTFLSEHFGITLEDGDFNPDNLATPARLAGFVIGRLQN